MQCVKCNAPMQTVERVVPFPKWPAVTMRFNMVDCGTCGYTTATDEQREKNNRIYNAAYQVAFPEHDHRIFG